MNQKFSEFFGSQWIKVKFYTGDIDLNGAEKAKNIRFCEATNVAIMHPVVLDKDNISCLSAQFVLGYRRNFKKELLDNCQNKRRIKDDILKTMFSQIVHFEKPFKYIGLNTKDEPDLVMSYVSPEQVMQIIKRYHDKCGKSLNVSLSPMMSICGAIAVKAFLEQNITLSFGCYDSRKFADIRRDRLAIGIPKKLFDVIL